MTNTITKEQAIEVSVVASRGALDELDWIHRFAQAAFKLGRNAGLDAALNCYSPDDTATDWADKIESLKDNTP